MKLPFSLLLCWFSLAASFRFTRPNIKHRVTVWASEGSLRGEEKQPNTAPVSKVKTVDARAILSYLSATSLQFFLITATLKVASQEVLPRMLPFQVRGTPATDIFAGVVMLALSLRSRIFSPLDNSRPKASLDDPVFKDRIRPRWQPPPFAFPIIWSIISILRTAAGVTIYRTTGSLVAPPLLAFYGHLCIGDTWNTINNVEGRLGTAALGVWIVLASVYNTVYQYYRTSPKAAYILAPSAVWLTVATALVTQIWRLNYEKFNHPSLLPSKEEGPASKWRLPLAALAIIV